MGLRNWKRKLTVAGCPHKDSPSAPQGVDPYVQAAAQSGLNRNTALLGNQLAKTDSYTPTGSTTWSSSVDPQDQSRYNTEMADYQKNMAAYQTAQQAWAANPSGGQRVWVPPQNGQMTGSYQTVGRGTFDPKAPTAPNAPIASKWTSTSSLTPEQQRLFDLKQSAQGTLYNQANTNLSKPLDFSGLDKQVSNLGLNNDFSGERQRVEDALYNRSTSRLDPQFAQQRTDMETKLYNQGVTPGTEAWNRELEGLGRTSSDAYAGARNDAIQAGGAEQSRLYGMDYQTANQNATLQNQARQQGLQELFALRQTPLQEINLLEGRSTQTGMPGGGGAAGGQPVANTDIGGAFAQQLGAQQAGYQGQVATSNANTGAAAAATTAIVMAAI